MLRDRDALSVFDNNLYRNVLSRNIQCTIDSKSFEYRHNYPCIVKILKKRKYSNNQS